MFNTHTPSLARLAMALCALAGALAPSAHAQLRPPTSSATPATPAAPAAPAAPSSAGSSSQETSDKETAGAMAAGGWLTLLDRKDWGTAWDTTSAMFRQSVPLPMWMEGIPKAREPFGALIERVPAETLWRNQLQGLPVGEYVTVRFATKYQNKEVDEIISTVREADGRWRVTGYQAR